VPGGSAQMSPELDGRTCVMPGGQVRSGSPALLHCAAYCARERLSRQMFLKVLTVGHARCSRVICFLRLGEAAAQKPADLEGTAKIVVSRLAPGSVAARLRPKLAICFTRWLVGPCGQFPPQCRRLLSSGGICQFGRSLSFCP